MIRTWIYGKTKNYEKLFLSSESREAISSDLDDRDCLRVTKIFRVTLIVVKLRASVAVKLTCSGADKFFSQ